MSSSAVSSSTVPFSAVVVQTSRRGLHGIDLTGDDLAGDLQQLVAGIVQLFPYSNLPLFNLPLEESQGLSIDCAPHITAKVK